jgi:hypothetical protein
VKWRRGPNHGGKTARSAPTYEGIRENAGVVGPRSMEGAPDRRSCSFFTKEQRKRSWPTFLEHRVAKAPMSKRESVCGRSGESEIGEE